MPLLLSDTFPILHSLTEMQHDDSCTVCVRMKSVAVDLLDDISVIATTDKVKNFLTEQMVNGNTDIKKKCIINSSYVIK